VKCNDEGPVLCRVQIKRKNRLEYGRQKTRQCRRRVLVFARAQRYAREKEGAGDTKIATAVATRLSLIKHSRDRPLAVPFHSNLSNYTIASRAQCKPWRCYKGKTSVQPNAKSRDMVAEHLSLAFNSPSTSNCRWLRRNLGRHPWVGTLAGGMCSFTRMLILGVRPKQKHTHSPSSARND